MPLDQSVSYRVNIDDSNFQAKLSQMRASLDMTMGGMAGAGMGMGGMGFMPSTMMGGMVNMMTPATGGGMMMGGLADFGTQIRPVTYTPPAIAMQPHFGMIQVQQSMMNAGLGMLAPPQLSLAQGFRDIVPPQLSHAEYMAHSTRAFGARLGDAVATGALVAGGTLASGVAGGVVGGMLGGGVLGFFGGGAAMTAVASYMGEVGDMMAQNRAIQTQLASGSFRFLTGGADVDPLMGRGLSRGARANVAGFVQSQELQDPRFDIGQYRQVLEAGMQMDVFSGTSDVADFKNKFKGLIDSVKTIASTLHTSLKEGVEVMRGFRDMGVTDPSMVNRLVMGSEVAGRVSGRTGMEMMAIGQAGAEMFRGTGVAMQRGFELNQLGVTQVREMLNQGTISRETVGQAGGEVALAQQMTANTLAAFQSSTGRGAMMAAYDPSTRGLRPDMLSRMAGQDIMGMVHGAAGIGVEGLLRLQGHQEEYISGLTAQQQQLFAIQTRMSFARSLQGVAPGLSMEDAYLAGGRMTGVSLQQLQADIGLMKMDPEKVQANQAAAIESVRRQANLEELRGRFSGKSIWNMLKSTFVQPVQRGLTEQAGVIEQAATDFGITAAGGNLAAPEMMTRARIEEGERLLSGGGYLSPNWNPPAPIITDARASSWQRIVGGESADKLGEAFARFGTVKGDEVTFSGGTARLYASKEAAEAAGAGGTIIGTLNDKLMILPIEEQRKATDAMRNLQPTQKAVDEQKKRELNFDTQVYLRRYAAAFGVSDVAKVLFGEKATLENITDIQKAELQAYARGVGGKLEEEYLGLTGTAYSADAARKSTSKLQSEAAELESSVVSEFTGRTAPALRKLGKESSVELIRRTMAAKDSDTAAQIVQNIFQRQGVSLDTGDYENIAERIRNTSKEKQQKLNEDLNKASAYTAEAQRRGAAVSGQGADDKTPISEVANVTRAMMEEIKQIQIRSSEERTMLEKLHVGINKTATRLGYK